MAGADVGDGFFRFIQDAAVRADRLSGQLDLILGDDGVADAQVFTRGGADEPDYLYRKGRLLVRDTHVDAVRDALDREDPGDDALDDGSDDDGVPNAGRRRVTAVDGGLDRGLTLVEVEGWSVPGACDKLDGLLGAGVVSPDHVFYICTASCCPADEPTPVKTAVTEPAPPGLKGNGRGVAVTVIDTGLVAALAKPGGPPWLAGVTGEPDPCVVGSTIGPYGGHGSFIAGVIRSVAPRTKVNVISFVDQSEKAQKKKPAQLKSGKAGALSESSILKALYQTMEVPPDVISLSGGFYTRRNIPPLTFEAFHRNKLSQVSTVLIAAAGNDTTDQPFWPAAFEWCVSVGALDADDELAPFSNFGPTVDVYARGVDMVNAFPRGKYKFHEPPLKGKTATFTPATLARWSGTSFSTPLVAGTIAARISRTGQSGSQAAASIRKIAQANAIPGVGAHVVPSMADQPDVP